MRAAAGDHSLTVVARFGAASVRSREEFRTATTIARKAAKPAKEIHGFFFASLATLRDKVFVSQLLSERISREEAGAA